MIASLACLRPDWGAQGFPPLKLFQRVIAVSPVMTMIVRG
jgi:hypothetical protein